MCVYAGVCECSGTLLSDALAGSAHLTVQLDHLKHGFLSPTTQVVKKAVVLLRQPVQHAEYVSLKKKTHTQTYLQECVKV